KLKILVVAWQILTVSSSITGVEYPAAYSIFLSCINPVILDMGYVASASCVLPSTNFYTRLLVSTLMPLVLVAGLVVTYQLAKRRAGIGPAGVFTSASTLTLETFTCDDDVGDGKSYLRADYSISCDSDLYMFFRGYAILIVLVYPLGVPVTYAAILWRKRDLLNPRIHTVAMSGPGQGEETATTAQSVREPELEELEERVNARGENPKLAPSKFLWRDFAPFVFYYEAIECDRRILLTGVLVFVAPNSSTQAAMACIFAFCSLLGFELVRPHVDSADAWLYRLGCVIIFLSNFLALLIKVDAGSQDNRSALGV
ncbi:unnamed protein product, partial [Laminaria digitata]